MKLTWDDVEEIAWALRDQHPAVDPLRLSYPTLRQWILALPDFDGAPDACNEALLERIQMAWLEARQDPGRR